MREFFYSRKKYALPAIHFLLSFLYERCIFLFREEENIILSIPRNQIISGTGERILGYVISKLLAAVMIFFLWHLLFWIAGNWKTKRNLRFFLAFFLI